MQTTTNSVGDLVFVETGQSKIQQLCKRKADIPIFQTTPCPEKRCHLIFCRNFAES